MFRHTFVICTALAAQGTGKIRVRRTVPHEYPVLGEARAARPVPGSFLRCCFWPYVAHVPQFRKRASTRHFAKSSTDNVTTMLDAGVDLRDVQIAARHADPRTTMRQREPARTLTGTRTISWPPTWPLAPDPARVSRRLCRRRRPALPNRERSPSACLSSIHRLNSVDRSGRGRAAKLILFVQAGMRFLPLTYLRLVRVARRGYGLVAG